MTAVARVSFAPSLQRHGAAPVREAEGDTVGAVLDAALADDPRLRAYVLDDQGRVRKHVAIYLGGARDAGRVGLDHRLGPRDEIFVFQALSGG